MNLTAENLRALESQELILEVFKVFHEIFYTIPTGELDEFMIEVIDATNIKAGGIGVEAREVLKYVLELEKRYRLQ